MEERLRADEPMKEQSHSQNIRGRRRGCAPAKPDGMYSRPGSRSDENRDGARPRERGEIRGKYICPLPASRRTSKQWRHEPRAAPVPLGSLRFGSTVAIRRDIRIARREPGGSPNLEYFLR